MPRKYRGFATDTEVSAAKSREDIERLLGQHHCTQYGVMVDHETRQARVQFRAESRIVRFTIPLPNQQLRGWEQLERQKWRQLLLVIKAKLESVAAKIELFEHAFLANIVLPGEQTVADVATPMIHEAYATGRMPKFGLAVPAKGESHGG